MHAHSCISLSISHSVRRSVSQSVTTCTLSRCIQQNPVARACTPLYSLVSRSVSQSFYQSVSQSVCPIESSGWLLLAHRRTCLSVSHSVSQSLSQSVSQSVRHAVRQSVGASNRISGSGLHTAVQLTQLVSQAVRRRVQQNPQALVCTQLYSQSVIRSDNRRVQLIDKAHACKNRRAPRSMCCTQQFETNTVHLSEYVNILFQSVRLTKASDSELLTAGLRNSWPCDICQSRCARCPFPAPPRPTHAFALIRVSSSIQTC